MEISYFPRFLVPKLCLGMPSAKLRFAPPSPAFDGRRETEFREGGSQTEFGNQMNRRNYKRHHFAAATTFFAASVNPLAVVMFCPLSASILRPNSTLVPSRRTTNGT